MKKIEDMRQKFLIVFACIAVLVVLYYKFTTLPEYEGKGKGFAGEILVKVTMDGEEIKKIIVINHKDDPRIANAAINGVIPEIIMKQSLKVDVIAGATYTSQGIKEGVRAATEKAGINFIM